MKKIMSPNDIKKLKEINWKDISIQKIINNEIVLILICESIEQANSLMNILNSNSFELETMIGKKSKCYFLNLKFSNCELKYNTNCTKENYPPIEWLGNALVKYISCGIWLKNGDAWYRDDLKILGKIILN